MNSVKKNDKLVDDTGFCFVCGGNGFLDKVCPSCGMAPKKKSFNLEVKEDVTEFVNKIDRFGVPSEYRGIAWDADTLIKYKQNVKNDGNFIHYVNQLDKINKVFCQGLIPAKSAIIISPPSYSKTLFAFSCIQRALDNGLTVAPMLDTMDLKRLLVLAADRPTYKLYGEIDYDSYVMADICFVKVTKLPQHEYAFSVIQELMEKRSRYGLGTIVLSDYSLSTISKKDRDNQFDSLSSSGTIDNFKYPAVIQYREML